MASVDLDRIHKEVCAWFALDTLRRELASEGTDTEEIGLAWLRRVARNRLIDVIRREDRYRDRLRLVGVSDDVDDHGGLVAGRLRVEQALAALAPAHRLVLVLHYLDEMTVQALADELGRSCKGAEALLTRARAALRAELEVADAG